MNQIIQLGIFFNYLSWIITWFSSSIHDLNVIARIFDFLLVSDPIVIYI
jgi:hypothetical protein